MSVYIGNNTNMETLLFFTDVSEYSVKINVKIKLHKLSLFLRRLREKTPMRVFLIDENHVGHCIKHLKSFKELRNSIV